jgi:O-antigen/teichoic acid export membrane protein
MKATSLFGGVQVFKILIGIIKSKFIAVFLGPAGMGIAGLIMSTLGLIASITNFGLETSAVKNIAGADATGDSKTISTIAGVLRRLTFFTGLLGSLSTLILAPWLSELTFGNQNYTLAFVWVAITLLLNQLSIGQIVILQGLRKIKLMAQASLLGSLIGLIIAVPIYYFWGIDGIVPVIILTSCFTLLVSFYFSRKVKIEKISIEPKTFFTEGKGMILMGFFIGLTSIIDQLLAYITKIFIGNFGDMNTVGLYDAGFLLINTYTGMIFAAMLADYYPRLSSVAKDNEKCKNEINQQAEIAILILAPAVIIFLVFTKIIILLLYSEQFLAIEGMIYWAMLGMIFKAINWSIGIIVLAKGNSKLYFKVYVIAAIWNLSTNLIGYYFWGIKGLGIAFFVYNFLFIAVSYGVAKINYSFSFDFALLKILSIQTIIIISCFIIIQIFISPFRYIIGCVLFLISLFYSYVELDKRVGIKKIIRNRFWK